MKNQNYFKKLLRLNRLPYFQDLTESQKEKIKGLEESYQELNPDFELPEKWKIAITKESIGPVGNWRDAGPIGKMNASNPDPKGWCTSHDGFYYEFEIRSNGYVEITLEQFKKYVLNEDKPRFQEAITLEPTTAVRRPYTRATR